MQTQYTNASEKKQQTTDRKMCRTVDLVTWSDRQSRRQRTMCKDFVAASVTESSWTTKT